MELDDKAKGTLARLERALDSTTTASFPEIIRLVHTLSQRKNEVTVTELSEIIQKDARMMVKILAVANTYGYRTGSTRVTTVEQAIQIVGFNRICSIAMSMMLLEQSTSHASEEQREASALALCAGTFAKHMEDMPVDRDLAFICASLRHFGRILIAAELPEGYREARKMMLTMEEDKAFTSVFGLTPLEISRAVLKHERLPQEITETLDDYDITIKSERNLLAALADFSAELSVLSWDPSISASSYTQRCTALSSKFGGILPEIDVQLPHLLTTAAQQLSHLKNSIGLTSLSGTVIERLKHRATHHDPVAPKAPAAAPPAHDGAASGDHSAVPSPKAPEPTVASTGPAAGSTPTADVSILVDGINEMRKMCSEGVDRREIYAALIDTIQSTLESAECFIMTPVAEHFRITQGCGRAWRSMRELAQVTPGEKSVFGLAFQRHEFILINDVSTSAYVPAWVRTSACPLGSFALLPLYHKGKIQSIIVAGWAHPHKFLVSHEKHNKMTELFALVTEHLSGQSA
jgi:HD-like signal output (HDOD) protein